jgi:hypothetical protein
LEKITSLPVVDSLRFTQFKLKQQRAPEINVVLAGITPKRDYPLIFVTPTLLGEEKVSRPNAPQSCCVAVSCP